MGEANPTPFCKNEMQDMEEKKRQNQRKLIAVRKKQLR
jgi:hypothetical protein